MKDSTKEWIEKHSPGGIKNKIYYDIPEEVYRDIPRVCQSDLKIAMQGSWKDYWFQVVMGNRKQQNSGERLGEVIHKTLLEPEKIQNVMWYDGKYGPNTKSFRDFCGLYKDQICLHPTDKTVFDLCDTLLLPGCLVYFKDKWTPLSELFEGGNNEVSFFWVDKETGIEMKGRTDHLNLEKDYVIDIKSTQKHLANEKGFRGMCRDFFYHVQDAVYTEGLKACTGYEFEDPFYFLCIEPKIPMNYGLYRLHPEERLAAVNYYKSYLVELKKCMEEDYWPSYECTEPINLWESIYT